MIQQSLLKLNNRSFIIEDLLNNYPNNINNYYEMFIGDGSVLFGFLSYIDIGIITCNGKIYAYDINEPLIYMYKNIQSYYNELYETLEMINKEYNKIDNIDDYNIDINDKTPKTLKDATLSKEKYYYWIKYKYTNMTNEEKNTILGSAYFIFLNKTTYKGKFINNEITNKETLYKIHNLIKNVIFEYRDLSLFKENIKDNDFIYIDNRYHNNKLYNFCNYLTKINIKFITYTNIKSINDKIDFEKYKIIPYKKSLFHLKYIKKGEIIIKNYDS